MRAQSSSDESSFTAYRETAKSDSLAVGKIAAHTFLRWKFYEGTEIGGCPGLTHGPCCMPTTTLATSGAKAGDGTVHRTCFIEI